MSLITKLLNRLSRPFDKTAGPVLAMRLSYVGGGMTWTIADDVLTTFVGGVLDQTIYLRNYTVGSLAGFLASKPGYVVLYLIAGPLVAVSALALVEGSGDLAVSNGDHLYVSDNPNWAYMSANSAELMTARDAIVAMPREMATTTADGEWLDFLGSWYAVPRLLREPDSTYSPRIPAEVILPRQNNFAIAAALETATGQDATIINAIIFGNPEPSYNGAIHHDGRFLHNASSARIYNLFDATIGYDLLGGLTPDAYAITIRDQIDRLRAAGTHLRGFTLTTSRLIDHVRRPRDSLVATTVSASLVGRGTSANFGLGSLPYLVGMGNSTDAGVGILSTQPAPLFLAAPVGGFAANATVLRAGVVNLAGAGGFTAQSSATRVWAGVAAMAGATSLSSLPLARRVASATLAGNGLVVARASGTAIGSAAMAGATSFLALPGARLLARATLAGAGLVAARPGSWLASASFAGQGGFTATQVQWQSGVAAPAGVGGFSATGWWLANASAAMAGSSSFVAGTGSAQPGAAALAGAGGFTGMAAQSWAASVPLLTGVGTISSPAPALFIGLFANLAGAATFAAINNIAYRAAGVTIMPAVGSFTGQPQLQRGASAALAAIASFTGNATQRRAWAGAAAMAGLGGFTTAAALRARASAALTGVASVFAQGSYLTGWDPAWVLNTGTVSGAADQIFSTPTAGGGIIITKAAHASGKWYAEMTVTGAGIATGGDQVTPIIGITTQAANLWGYTGQQANPSDSVGFFAAHLQETYYNTTQQQFGLAAGPIVSGNVVSIAVDADNHLVYFLTPQLITAFGANGWNGLSTAAPQSQIGGITYSLTTGAYLIAFCSGDATGPITITLNTGGSAFARTPPTGFLAWDRF